MVCAVSAHGSTCTCSWDRYISSRYHGLELMFSGIRMLTVVCSMRRLDVIRSACGSPILRRHDVGACRHAVTTTPVYNCTEVKERACIYKCAPIYKCGILPRTAQQSRRSALYKFGGAATSCRSTVHKVQASSIRGKYVRMRALQPSTAADSTMAVKRLPVIKVHVVHY